MRSRCTDRLLVGRAATACHDLSMRRVEIKHGHSLGSAASQQATPRSLRVNDDFCTAISRSGSVVAGGWEHRPTYSNVVVCAQAPTDTRNSLRFGATVNGRAKNGGSVGLWGSSSVKRSDSRTGVVMSSPFRTSTASHASHGTAIRRYKRPPGMRTHATPRRAIGATAPQASSTRPQIAWVS